MLHNIIKILIIALLGLFAYAGYTTIAKANNAVSLGQVTAENLLSSQANGVLVIDIRHEDEWRDTGVIEGAKTVTAFQKNGQTHPDFQQKLFSSVPNPLFVPSNVYLISGDSLGSKVEVNTERPLSKGVDVPSVILYIFLTGYVRNVGIILVEEETVFTYNSKCISSILL